MDATPHRIKVALNRAFERLTAEIDAQAVRDGRGRPTQAVLLAEAVGLRINTSICSRCFLEKQTSEFGTTADNRCLSWCRVCQNDYARGAYANTDEGEVAQADAS